MKVKSRTKELTPYQARFVQAYLVDPCATRAVIESRKPRQITYLYAQNEGMRLLRKPQVIREIKAGSVTLLRASKMSAKKVINGLVKVAKCDPLDFFEEDEHGNMRPRRLKDIPYRARLALVSIKFRVLSRKVIPETIDGKDVLVEQVAEIIEFKIGDRVAALDKLMKHAGLYLKDNKQKRDITPAEAEALREKLKERGVNFEMLGDRSEN